MPRRSRTTPPTTLPAMTPAETDPPPPLPPAPSPDDSGFPPGFVVCPLPPLVVDAIPVAVGFPLEMVDAILVAGSPSRLGSHMPRPLNSTDLTPKKPEGQQKYRLEVRPNKVHAGLAQSGRFFTAVLQSASARRTLISNVNSQTGTLSATYQRDSNTPPRLS